MPTVLTLPDNAPRAKTPRWLMTIATKTMALAGWKMAGEWPNRGKMVIIAAPHSSAWDAIWGLMAKAAMDLHLVFMGKQEAFAWPIGPLLRWLGGIPVNRTAPGGIADQVAQQIINADRMWFLLAPEGTRKPVDQWKAGFWKIAKKADVPVLCAYFDYANKTIGIGPLFELSNDMDADIAKIRAWYAPIKGKHRGV